MGYSNFENIYAEYCPMLYGMALEICHSKKKTAELLKSAFRKIDQKICQEKYPVYCITLMRLIIKTAQELYPTKYKSCFRLKQFENTPIINQLIFDQISLQDYCKENFLTQQEALQIIRKEFSIIKNSKKDKKVSTDTSIPDLFANILNRRQKSGTYWNLSTP
jgi:hypothetical protein